MIEELRLSSFGSISAELLFSQGFNVIIGETGAGKSLLLSSIEFLKGKKSNVVFEGSFVEAVFNVQGEEIFIRREIKNGRSRYFLNGMRVPQNLVEKKLFPLITFQSQRQSIELLKPSYQLKLLDVFSTVTPFLKEYKKIYELYRQKEIEFKKLLDEMSAKDREIDILRFQIEEIKSVNFQKGEEEELLALREVLLKSESVKRFKSLARRFLYDGEDSALEKIEVVIRELEELGVGEEILNRLNSVYYEIEDIYSEIEKSFVIPEEDISLEAVEERLYEIEKLKRKYGNSYEEVQKFLKKIEGRLEALENLDFEVEKVQRDLENLKKELESLASKISELRKKGAEKLKEYLISSFSELCMESARFEIKLKPLEDFLPTGKDSVEFLFSGNPKLPLSLLSSSISGGELSRFLLSVLTFFTDSKTTIVFDEIDSGMSGKVLSKVAEKLKKISQKQQIIAVTHSPQILAAADKVFKVEKDQKGEVIVKTLSDEEKKREIAIMITGKITKGSLSAAEDLLNRWEE
ncbi:DNA repair protein RecN [Desulfurobacterium thermolithotrophum]|uniref:DNA repair protein RecN n=1 Tax=Desulfurobacterium thermolithotrophum TaxID=64160 RepID=UPI0013D3FEAB|nr:AAA family ATPase [Desulfurobacterium thermolithotrophum]